MLGFFLLDKSVSIQKAGFALKGQRGRHDQAPGPQIVRMGQPGRQRRASLSFGKARHKGRHWPVTQITVREKVTGRRAARMVYEHVGHDLGRARDVSRKAGLVTLEHVPPFHARLLRLDENFR